MISSAQCPMKSGQREERLFGGRGVRGRRGISESFAHLSDVSPLGFLVLLLPATQDATSGSPPHGAHLLQTPAPRIPSNRSS